ncbi:hypothetical protein H310_10401 [Aphanomyces invadans]|uniref:Secreted protein n=1 Tax=Aphanomyces invadans TaxID=157072 RepID=A0A024TRF4_9STRA|nr:hypothetical protein H310_10401 [Aphanomyces invadans]ETV96211.1 hypothetical protein H310_10401 [Aphanomyces invadans]|eukprot:XP_008875003.1 hypothetical protein H310_10401 [Aphanomyces invadans]
MPSAKQVLLVVFFCAWGASVVEAIFGNIPFGMFWKGRIYGRISCEPTPLACPGGGHVFQLERLGCEYPPCPPTLPPPTTPSPVMTSARVRIVRAFVYTGRLLPRRRPSRKHRADISPHPTDEVYRDDEGFAA